MVAIAPFIAAVLAPFIQRVIGSATGWLLALLPAAIFAYLTTFIAPVAGGQPVHARIAWIPAYGIDLSFLVDGLSLPVASFTSDGLLIGSSDAARPLLGFHNLVEAGLDEARNEALTEGAVATSIDIGRMVLQRVGTGADVALVALLVPDAARAAHPEPVAAAQSAPQEAKAEPTDSDLADATTSQSAQADAAMADSSSLTRRQRRLLRRQQGEGLLLPWTH